ncbi:hypothetical protein DPEC_G00137310 [Dallia pectoralis]|uniref:Uncharacterized protein n=1 Tax=Dallia pectoralis TaxID=75939 RepID=A0ACC2GM61_DALPE|nr:hypothetical protein DPEC_G00137310 [Dallia pectoralis]
MTSFREDFPSFPSPGSTTSVTRIDRNPDNNHPLHVHRLRPSFRRRRDHPFQIQMHNQLSSQYLVLFVPLSPFCPPDSGLPPSPSSRCQGDERRRKPAASRRNQMSQSVWSWVTRRRGQRNV